MIYYTIRCGSADVKTVLDIATKCCIEYSCNLSDIHLFADANEDISVNIYPEELDE